MSTSMLCDALRGVGVDIVFGLPGTQNVRLFDAFRRGGLRTVLASHELAAAFMANGYFRATGRIAALATIPGPGFAYALTGIAEAKLDSVGMLWFVARHRSKSNRQFELQAIDQGAISAPILKGSLVLQSAADTTRIVAEAHHLASEGEPGPVMVELDLDALSDDEVSRARHAPDGRAAAVPDGVAELTRLFSQCERPALLLGLGALGSAERLQRIAETLNVPVITTPSARGILPEDHDLAMGFDPLRGDVAHVNALLEFSDLVIGLGCKLGHNGSAGFQLQLPPDRFVHVDASDTVLCANYPARLAINARVEHVVGALEQRVSPTAWDPAELSAFRTAVRVTAPDEPEPRVVGTTLMRPEDFFGWLRNALPRDAILVTDSGLHQILTRRYFDVLSPRGLICPNDFQSMGFGLPAAIGAKLGAPDRQVVVIVGDGGFMMSGLELLTAVREGLALTVFVWNDGYLNQIRVQQLGEYGHAHGVRLLNPDYARLAEALHIDYMRFDDRPLSDAVQALNRAEPMLVEVVVQDSLGMRRLATVARAKSAARRAIKASWLSWLLE